VEPDSDGVLTRRAAAGDRDAFATLYRRHQRTVFRFARQMSGSDATAEDVTQDVFLILMRQIGQYDPQRASLATLLYGIARNVILQRLARTRPTLTIDEIESTDEEPAVESDALGAIQRAEIVRRVRQAILELRHRSERSSCLGICTGSAMPKWLTFWRVRRGRCARGFIAPGGCWPTGLAFLQAGMCHHRL
jgi:RNA polymerase sigma factor (sigma-70 family)